MSADQPTTPPPNIRAIRKSEVDYLRGLAQTDIRLSPDEYEAILLVLNDRLTELDKPDYGRPPTWTA